MLRVPKCLPILATFSMIVVAACSSVENAPAPIAAPSQSAPNVRAGGASDAANRFQTVNGSIATIDGQRFALTTTTTTVQVSLVNQTRFIKMEPVKIADLKQGDTITVRGANDRFGNLVADTVQLLQPQGGVGDPGAQGQRAQRGAPGDNRAQGNNDGAGGNTGNRPQGSAAGGQFQQQGGAGTGASTRARGQRAGIVGQIEKIEGTAIIISEQSGGAQLFIVNGNTSFLRPSPGTQADLRTGLTVSVAGQAGADGAINATLVTIGDELAAN